MDNYVELDRTTEQLEKAIDMTNSEVLGERAVTYGMEAEAEGQDSIAIGQEASSEQGLSVAIGNYAQTTAPQGVAEKSIAIGANAVSAANEAIQIGDGTNDVANTTKIKSTTILDATGKIPFSALQGGEVVGLAVNSSNHLIVTYANGATADLGAIGGGSGTTDYGQLTNKPQVNGNTLSGNKTGADLGLQELLQSGTNIKTINGTSLLGSGDVQAGIPELPAAFYAAETVGDVLSSQSIQSGIYKATQSKTFEIGNPLDLAIVPDDLILIIREDSYKRIVVVDTFLTWADDTGNCDSSALYSELDEKQNVNVRLTIGQSQTQTQTVTQWLQGLYDEVVGASAIVSQIEEVIGNGT